MNQTTDFLSYRVITLPAQIGGPKAAKATEPHLIELRKLLFKHCPGPYSREVREFALIFRIDGEIQKFNCDGCERLRRSFKEHYVTIDLCVPERQWRGVPASRLRRYLRDMVKEALRLCVQRLRRDKTSVDDKRLFLDYAKVEEDFLKVD